MCACVCACVCVHEKVCVFMCALTASSKGASSGSGTEIPSIAEEECRDRIINEQNKKIKKFNIKILYGLAHKLYGPATYARYSTQSNEHATATSIAYIA